MSIPGRPLPTRVTPARPTDKRRAHGASSPLFRERPTKRASRASSQRPSTKGVRVSSRRSESSSASSVSPYDARRRSATSHPSSHSQPVSPWSNPSTQPKKTGRPIIVSSFDRISRETKTLNDIVQENGLTIISAGDGKMRNPVIIASEAARAQREGELISQRTKEALARKKAEGVLLGNRTNLPEARRLAV